VVVVCTVAGLTLSIAQNAPVSSAQVEVKLDALYKAGYKPATDHNVYATNIQAAEARVASKHPSAATYGPKRRGTTQSGEGRKAVTPSEASGLHEHH
jgi:tRNA U34 5-methylaminomethyl-2-thiouridine-forming methyltransferase MnmC